MTSIKVTNIPVQPLFLGFPGENDSRPVYVDVSPWLEEFPDATVSIVYTRSDGLTYAVVVNQTGPVVTWKPMEADLVGGKCSLQIQIKQGDAVKKDRVVDCVVGKSLDDPSDPPQDPRPTYVEEVIDAADRAEAAVTHYPQIRNDYWWVWDAESGKWVNTGVKATGEGGGNPNAVLYTPQTLTDAQQEQARGNIGAAAEGEGGSSVELTPLNTAYFEIPYTQAPGYIGSNGSIIAAGAVKEVYTSKIKVSGGELLTVDWHDASVQDAWIALGAYDASDTFLNRVVIFNGLADTFHSRVLVPDGAEYVAFTFRTFGTATFSVTRQWAFPEAVVSPTKNLFRSAWSKIYYVDGTPAIAPTNRNVGTMPEIPVVGGKTYTVSIGTTEYTGRKFLYVYQYSADGTFLSYLLRTSFPATFTLDFATEKIGLVIYAGDAMPTDYRQIIPNWAQMEEGVVSTDYKAPFTLNPNLISEEVSEKVWGNVEGAVASCIAASSSSRTVQTVAHRGDMIEAPQCTEPAYIAARKRGIMVAENDLTHSEDGAFVMWHDTSLSRLGDIVDINGYLMYTDGTDYYWVNAGTAYTWDGTEYVASAVALADLTRCAGADYGVNSDYGTVGLSLDVLKRIDFGVYKGDQFKGTQILTLADWILLCKQLGMDAYIDRKLTYTDALIEAAANVVSGLGMADHVSWIGLTTVQITKLRELIPNARCGLLVHPSDSNINTMKPYNIGRGIFFNGDASTMVEADIQKGLRAGFDVEVWYGSENEGEILTKIREAVSYGVTAITLNHYRVEDAYAIATNPAPAETPAGERLYKVSQLVNDSGYQTAAQVQTAISGKADKVLRVAMTAADEVVALNPNTLYVFPEMASLAITLATPTDTDIVNEYHFIFTSGSTATTLSIPATVNQPDGFTVEANHVYEVSILENNMTAMSWEVTA